MKLVNDKKYRRGVCIVVNDLYFSAYDDAELLSERYGVNAGEFSTLQSRVLITEDMTDDERLSVMVFINALPAA